jgi:hypothetical protein
MRQIKQVIEIPLRPVWQQGQFSSAVVVRVEDQLGSQIGIVPWYIALRKCPRLDFVLIIYDRSRGSEEIYKWQNFYDERPLLFYTLYVNDEQVLSQLDGQG